MYTEGSREELKKLVFSLCSAEGVAGCEENAAALAEALLRRYTDRISRSPLGSVTAMLGEGERCLLLDAHLDQIGLVVTNLLERGFLRFSRCGGIDRRVLIGKPVVILGRRRVRGIISSIPPQLAKAADDKLPEMEEMMIDTGLAEDELKELVVPGDRILIEAEPVSLLNDRVASPALDDRCSMAAILRCLELLQGKQLPCRLAVQFSVQEETGGSGAETGAFALQPDEAIAVDVSFAQGPGVPEKIVARLGEGPLIGISPALSHRMSKVLEELAQENGIPYQLEVMGGATGTNADNIVQAGGGAVTGLVSIAQRSMHTAVEIVSLADVEATAQLLAAYVLKGGVCNG